MSTFKEKPADATVVSEPATSESLASPAFVIGVTGNMDLVPQAAADDPFGHIKEPVRKLFRFLRGAKGSRAGLEALLVHRDFARGLEHWRGLPAETPIVVLSSLAPGADTLVAQLALEEEFANQNFHVQAPLPFPADAYREASTFRPNGATDEEVQRLQEDYDAVLAKVRAADSDAAFPVLLDKDLESSEAEQMERFAKDVNDSVRRRLRYQAAGEYVAIHCDLLLAIWDDDDPACAPEGTAAVVEAKRRGPTSDLLPEATALTWVDSISAGANFSLHPTRSARGSFGFSSHTNSGRPPASCGSRPL